MIYTSVIWKICIFKQPYLGLDLKPCMLSWHVVFDSKALNPFPKVYHANYKWSLLFGTSMSDREHNIQKYTHKHMHTHTCMYATHTQIHTTYTHKHHGQLNEEKYIETYTQKQGK